MIARRLALGVCAALVAGVVPAVAPSSPVVATLDDPLAAPELVEDINLAGRSGEPQDFVTVGDSLFFTAQPSLGPRGLFEYQPSDGSIRQVPLDAGLDPQVELEVDDIGAPIGGELVLFTYQYDPVAGETTYQVVAVAPGGAPRTVVQLPGEDSVRESTGGDGIVYFTRDDELWTTDGTAGGTSFRVGGLDRRNEMIAYERPDGTEVLVIVEDGALGDEITRIDFDTLPAPTVTRYDINVSGDAFPTDLAVIDGVLWFIARDGTTQNLYSLGGNTPPAAPTNVRLDVRWLRVSDTHLFTGESNSGQAEVVRLLASDTGMRGPVFSQTGGSTEPGPALADGILFVVAPGGGPRRFGSSASWFGVANSGDADQIVVSGDPLGPGFDVIGAANGDRSAALVGAESDGDDELWRVGINGSPSRLDPRGEWNGLDSISRLELSPFGNTEWVFVDEALTAGEEAHVTSDGGTVVTVADAAPATDSSSVGTFVDDGEGVDFLADIVDQADRPFRYDAATNTVSQTATVPTNVTPSTPVVVRDGVGYFVGRDGFDSALYRVDDGVTTMVGPIFDDIIDDDFAFGDDVVLVRRDRSAGTLHAVPFDGSPVIDLGVISSGALVPLGDVFVFASSTDDPGGREPWVTGGTLASTMPLAETSTGVGDVTSRMFRLGDRVFFNAVGELWSTDGTVAGTMGLGTSLGLDPLAASDTELLTTDGDGQLRVVSGSPATATLVDMSAVPSGAVLEIPEFAPAGSDGTSFALAVRIDGGEQLGLVIDGVLELVVLSPDDPAADRFGPIVMHRGIAYAALNRDDRAGELIRSDGTEAGTGAIFVQPINRSIRELRIVGERLVLPLLSELAGEELFSLDVGPGTPDAPTSVTAVGGEGSATISWTAPTGTGGVPLTGYTVTASPGGATCSTTGVTTCTISGLADGSYTFTVTASNELKTSPASAPSSILTLGPESPDVISLVPRRFLESRPGQVTFDGQGELGRRVGAGETVRVQITGRGGVPVGTSGVVANVTAVFPSAVGFVTVWDCAGDPPTASSLNYGPGQVVPNELVAKLSPTGELCLFSRAETDLLVDLVGLVPAESSLVSLAPRRFFESRAGESTFDGQDQPGVRVSAGETVRVQITGRGGVPAGTSGVVANVTAVFPSGPGFVTVWDCQGDPPTASSLNYGPGAVVPNELVAKLSPSGELCLSTRAETDLLVDVVGLVPAGSDIVSLVPARFFESRSGEVTFDGDGQPGARVGAGATVRVDVAGRGDVPANASGVVVNVTAVFPSGPGFVTVWDCQGDPPTASSLNYGPGQVVPNELIAKLSPSGELCLFTRAETDLLVDVVGAIT